MGPVPPGATPDQGQYDSFVVRIFSHGMDRGDLRGQVTHVATRETLRFTNLERINHFILVHLGSARSANPGQESCEDAGFP